MEIQQATSARLLGQFVGSTITTIANADANRDGVLQTGEIFGALLAVLLKGAQVFDSFETALRELKEQGNPAREELLAGLAAEFNLTNDELELLIEDTLSFIEDGITITERWVAYTKRNEAIQS